MALAGYHPAARARLAEILKNVRIVREFRKPKGPPLLLDVASGEELARGSESDLLHFRDKNNWHLLWHWPRPERGTLHATLANEGWSDLANVPEKEPVQLYLWNKEGGSPSSGAFVLVHSGWFIADPFAEALPINAVAWRPWAEANMRARAQP